MVVSCSTYLSMNAIEFVEFVNCTSAQQMLTCHATPIMQRVPTIDDLKV